jgi:NAD(P)H-quinone oxidoreductase subunit 4L
MTLGAVLFFAALLWGVGLYGALSQQSFVMLMMGLELMVNAAILAGAGMWRFAGGGAPGGQLLVILGMTVMAIEMVIGFAVVVNLYRVRQADVTESVEGLAR